MKLTKDSKIAVTSRSFCKSEELRNNLTKHFLHTKFNEIGISLKGSALLEFLSGCDGAIIALEPIDRELISNLPNLRYISKYGVGLDSIDISALQEARVELLISPGVNSYSVAEVALSSAISLLHLVPHHQNSLASGVWKQEKGREFKGKSVGVIGCGHVGMEFLKLSSFFGTELKAYDLNPNLGFFSEFNIKSSSINEIFESCDVISVHLPLNSVTRNLISHKYFKLMKKNAIILNYSRGGIVNESDLYDHLVNNNFSGAAIDVFQIEPIQESKLLLLPNLIATPHIGGSTEEAILAMGNAAINQLVSKIKLN